MRLGSKIVPLNVAGPATLSVGDVTGAAIVVLKSSNAAPGTLTTRTATEMVADHGGVSDPYILRIVNIGAGTLTLALGTGVTNPSSSTLTVAQNKSRDFLMTFTSATTMTIECIGDGTYS